MRQAITIFSLFGSFVIFALTVNLFETVVMLLLFGVLPDRSEPISANVMLSVYVASGTLVFGYIVQRNLSRLRTYLRMVFPKVTA